MRSNAALFRAAAYAEHQMALNAMPRLADLEWEPRPEVEDDYPSTLRVTIAEVSGTRLCGFRRVVEVQ